MYVALVDDHLDLLAEILALAREIEPWTIEKVLAKTDLELGIQAVTTRFNHPT